MEGQVESTIGGAGNDMATDFTGFEDHDSEGPVFETNLMTHTKQADLSVFTTEATEEHALVGRMVARGQEQGTRGLFLGPRPKGTLEKIKNDTKWATDRSTSIFSAQDSDYLAAEGVKLMSMARLDGTRKGYSVAVGWFRKFMRRWGFETDLLYVDTTNPKEREFGAQFLVKFGVWLGMVCANQERVVGLAKAETIEEYLSQVITFHYLETCQRVDFHYTKPLIKALIAGRKNLLTDSLGIQPKKKKVQTSPVPHNQATTYTTLLQVGISAEHFLRFDALNYEFRSSPDSPMPAKVRNLNESFGKKIVACLIEAASKTAFGGAFRRAEVSVKNPAELNILRVMSRACIRWFGPNKIEIPPTLDKLRQLYEERHLGGFAEIEIKGSKADPHGTRYGRFRVILPLTSEGEVKVDSANALLRYEILIPCSNPTLRNNTFIFSFPDGSPLETSDFDSIMMHLLWRCFQLLGDPKTMKEVRKLYSLHSFRIGALNAFRLGGMNELVCMVAGRWSHISTVREYVRSENDEMLQLMKSALSVSCQFNQTIDPSLPAYPLSRALPQNTPGTYVVRPGDQLDNGETPENSMWLDMPDSQKDKLQIKQNLANELDLIVGLEVAKRFYVPLPEERQKGRKKQEARYWKGRVISTGKDPKFPVEVQFEPNPDGTIDIEEWDLDAYRKGRETFRTEYPHEWEQSAN